MSNFIIGNMSWYGATKPVLFKPELAHKGEVFFKNGYPLDKFEFLGNKLESDGIIIKEIVARNLRTGNETYLDITESNIYVYDNKEHLNYTNAMGMPFSPDLFECAVPASIILKYFPVINPFGKNDLLKRLGGIIKIQYQDKVHSGRVTDIGCGERLVGMDNPETQIIDFSGRIVDGNEEFFKFFADPRIGLLKGVKMFYGENI